MAKLTDKQELFAREYLKDLNGTQAAIRAGYSEKTSQEQSSRLLSNVMVQDRIAELKAERNEQIGVDAAYVLRRLTEIDQMDVLDILLANGELKPIKDWPKVWRTTLSGMDVVEMASADSAALLKKIKWPDKVKNLELLGKHVDVQAFKENIKSEHSGPNGGPIQYTDITNEELEERLKELGHGRHRSQLAEKQTDA
ncbi:terminase small subunit [Escherichia coli]|uniref:terminase small subunit n=1 Tax=Escherichia coli TaxID=562 RepID=UPI001F057694|nr:terminase small subunit [Escherichia coli]MCH0685585.1 terminase small subunit [Escherichia coli]MDZ8667086.1 terminase small subunit [Escherichia coli]WRX87668.1 terminase small subunit [Escherichia coli]